MAEAVLSEAPLKRKLEGASEASECKKPRECVSQSISAAEPAANTIEIDGTLAHSDGNIGELKLPAPISAGSEEPNTIEIDKNLKKRDGGFARHDGLMPSAEASGSTSAGFEESDALGEGEVLEAALEQVDDDKRGDADDEDGELSEIDTENDSEDEDENEGAGSDEDGDDSDESSDDEDDEEDMPTSTSSSLAARKGKEKMVDDVKGKGIMPLDKGKGKALAEEEATPGSDEDDAGYLSEDPLEEVDLNNILPTRTRRQSSSTHYDFVDDGDDDDDDDDTDA